MLRRIARTDRRVTRVLESESEKSPVIDDDTNGPRMALGWPSDGLRTVLGWYCKRRNQARNTQCVTHQFSGVLNALHSTSLLRLSYCTNFSFDSN